MKAKYDFLEGPRTHILLSFIKTGSVDLFASHRTRSDDISLVSIYIKFNSPFTYLPTSVIELDIVQ